MKTTSQRLVAALTLRQRPSFGDGGSTSFPFVIQHPAKCRRFVDRRSRGFRREKFAGTSIARSSVVEFILDPAARRALATNDLDAGAFNRQLKNISEAEK
jgi:hypothetical protein